MEPYYHLTVVVGSRDVEGQETLTVGQMINAGAGCVRRAEVKENVLCRSIAWEIERTHHDRRAPRGELSEGIEARDAQRIGVEECESEAHFLLVARCVGSRVLAWRQKHFYSTRGRCSQSQPNFHDKIAADHSTRDELICTSTLFEIHRVALSIAGI